MTWRRYGWIGLGTVGCLLLVIQLRAVWLPWIPQYLIVEDVLHPAEVIVVFAGAHGARARYAASLYHQGLASRIVVTGELTSKTLELFCQQRWTGADMNARVLAEHGVPQEAIIVRPRGTSTYEEGKAVQAFIETHAVHSIIAVSSLYHMRRVKATLEHLLQGAGVEVQYSPEKESDFKVEQWWKRERDLVEIMTEFMKLFHYHLTYF